MVLGIDKDTEESAVFYGRDVLKEARRAGGHSDLRAIGFRLDPTSDQREYLAVMVHRLKGSCCFQNVDELVRRSLGNRQVKVAGDGSTPDFHMPARVLNQDMVRGRMQETGEEVWVESAQLANPRELRHPPFPAGVRAKVSQILDTFKEVHPLTLAEWEDGFRHDMHPEREIAIWLHLRECYLHFTGGRPLTLDQKRDIFEVIVLASFNGSAVAGETVRCPTLSRRRVREIAAFVEGTWKADA